MLVSFAHAVSLYGSVGSTQRSVIIHIQWQRYQYFKKKLKEDEYFFLELETQSHLIY